MSKKRNPNFSSAEIQVLLDEVERNKEVIFCKLSNIVTNAAKKRAWESICEKINSCNSSSHTRTVEEIRKKWSSYTSDAKKKASQQRRESAKTGGGPPPIELDALQDRVVGIIENLPIDGIPGGHDTARSNEGNILSSGIGMYFS
ncbi:myb/SANT-like DNA-binding domain-containing protein 4 [Saccostrea cucullata]|uniref:myb/SANT-like DNA-binding domain-containing protein 4 n=1 Tax=Saccostrea cuccullata TaxID=36930 RepID=UPI002ED52FA4